MKNIVLFDMDGTLTPARKPMGHHMFDALSLLAQYADIGIVSGSPFEYIREQCSQIFENCNELWLNDVVVMPCNGTQKYIWENGRWEKVFSLDMRQEIGEEVYGLLMRELILEQHACSMHHEVMGFSLAGHFISYRDSMVNWSPIGRAATHVDRDKFVKADQIFKIRDLTVEKLNKNPVLTSKLNIALGGHTSVDIYPIGWDKTYALNHYDSFDNIWFIGDKCLNAHGNDKPLYETINQTYPGHARQTSGPSETIELIKEIINSIEVSREG